MAFDPRTSFQEDPSFTAFSNSSPRLSTSTSHPITAPYSDSSDSSGDDDDDEPLRPLRVAPSYRRPASYYATDLPDPSFLVPSSPGSSYGVVRSGADGGGGARSRQAVVNRRYPGRLPGEGDMSMEFSEGKHKRDERKHREAEERRKKHKHKEEEEKEHERREEKRHEEEEAKRERKAKAKRERKEREEHEHEHEHKHKHRAKPAPAATTDDSSSGSNSDGKKGKKEKKWKSKADTGSSIAGWQVHYLEVLPLLGEGEVVPGAQERIRLRTRFWAARDYLSPVLRDSKFKDSGRITPDEFVAAGDFLVYKFPTWQWEAGDKAKARDFLPKDKQYLVSRSVPCLRRVSQLAYGSGDGEEDSETLMSFALDSAAPGDDDDDWVATHTSRDPSAPTKIPTIGDIPDLDASVGSLETGLAGTRLDGSGSAAGGGLEEMPDMDDIPDMDDDDAEGGGLVEEEDDAALKPVTPAKGASDNLVQVRTYDCSITYDKYYQTPRMWLLGYDEHKSPLPPASALEDVSADHAQKTVTIEPFPHSSLSMASVHPCKHSSVMKKVIERMDTGVVEAQRRQRESDKKDKKWLKLKPGASKDKAAAPVPAGLGDDEGPEGLRVDQYLVVFLKFMSSIVPTIEVDATNSI